MKKIKFILILLVFDLTLSNLIFKNTQYWSILNLEEKWWRVSSKDYHHKILPNIDQIENWGGKIQKRVITNSLGFFDKENREILKSNKYQKRILLIGDSFIEGSGLPYEKTFAGLLASHLGSEYEVLNSALGSYSPSIYFKKTEFYINKGYKVDQALVFLDISDIFDELFIKFDNNGNILTYEETKKQNVLKKNFYKFGSFLRDNFIIFRLLRVISDQTEIIKNYVKLRFKASKNLDKSFFDTKRDDVMYYRMTHIDRGFWTFNDKKFDEVKKGLSQSNEYLTKLFNLFKEKNVDASLIIYPWPTQILYGDEFHQKHWLNFSNQNKINFVNLYDKFQNEEKRKFIFENFIYGDIHWNEKGTKLIFDGIIEKIDF